ncbi:unnamed protein product [Spodoptera exigua]|uniref:Cuticular protein CPG n=1 Tax=Spodoptera exigua TaxID=7107 RepID=A0A835L977_SPOEX|nr:hypothetical protein HW555_000184 [Spodoptera exigua]CAH0695918.1 unnamed protein product [Spodoptera exigua]
MANSKVTLLAVFLAVILSVATAHVIGVGGLGVGYIGGGYGPGYGYGRYPGYGGFYGPSYGYGHYSYGGGYGHGFGGPGIYF